MAASPIMLCLRPWAVLAAVALGLCAAGCFGSSEQPGPAGPPPSEDGWPAATPPPDDGANMPENPEKPPHQLCTADLQEFVANGVKVEDLEKKIEHGLELGVTSLPLLATPEELTQLREQGIPQELLDKWAQPAAGVAAAPPAPEGAAP